MNGVLKIERACEMRDTGRPTKDGPRADRANESVAPGGLANAGLER
jgi:hypothetical protein